MKRIAKLPEASKEKVVALDARAKPSPGPKVKTFEEIMEEKKAKRLGRFGGASAGDAQINRKVKVNQRIAQKLNNLQEASKRPFLL